jgi:hypothetical protein
MAYLERDRATGEQVAIKYIPRGATVRRRWRAALARAQRTNPELACAARAPAAHAPLTRCRGRRAQINANVQRETVSHRLLRHPNIIAFKKAREASRSPAAVPLLHALAGA